jgi:hypothetical protein
MASKLGHPRNPGNQLPEWALRKTIDEGSWYTVQ